MKSLTIAGAWALSLCLAACASAPTREPKVEVQTVYIPTPVSCVDKGFKDRPALPDTDAALKAAPDLDSFIKLLLAGRTIRDAWEGTAHVQINICRKAGG